MSQRWSEYERKERAGVCAMSTTTMIALSLILPTVLLAIGAVVPTTGRKK